MYKKYEKISSSQAVPHLHHVSLSLDLCAMQFIFCVDSLLKKIMMI